MHTMMSLLTYEPSASPIRAHQYFNLPSTLAITWKWQRWCISHFASSGMEESHQPFLLLPCHTLRRQRHTLCFHPKLQGWSPLPEQRLLQVSDVWRFRKAPGNGQKIPHLPCSWTCLIGHHLFWISLKNDNILPRHAAMDPLLAWVLCDLRHQPFFPTRRQWPRWSTRCLGKCRYISYKHQSNKQTQCRNIYSYIQGHLSIIIHFLFRLNTSTFFMPPKKISDWTPGKLKIPN